MAKLSKRMKENRSIIDRTREYPVTEAFETLIKCPKAKFVESVDVAIQLGIDPTKSDQNVRGATVLPHGNGRTVRVCVFTQGAAAEAAKAAGADLVGMDELAAEIKKGMMDFVAQAVKNAKSGQVRYRNDKTGVIQASIGKVNFTVAQLTDNLNALLGAITKAKPASSKGTYIKKVCVSTTMGGGVTVEKSSLNADTSVQA